MKKAMAEAIAFFCRDYCFVILSKAKNLTAETSAVCMAVVEAGVLRSFTAFRMTG